MLKKAGMFMMVLLLVVTFAGCGGGSSTAITPDKVAVDLPETLIPQGVEIEKEDSHIYYETTMPLEEIVAFYTTAFQEIGVTVNFEMKEQDFFDKKIIIDEEGIDDTIVWGLTGTKGTDAVPYSVVVAEQNGTFGVSVGVGYRGGLMAQGMGENLAAEAEEALEAEPKA